jgi:hypothetical protein
MIYLSRSHYELLEHPPTDQPKLLREEEMSCGKRFHHVRESFQRVRDGNFPARERFHRPLEGFHSVRIGFHSARFRFPHRRKRFHQPLEPLHSLLGGFHHVDCRFQSQDCAYFRLPDRPTFPLIPPSLVELMAAQSRKVDALKTTSYHEQDNFNDRQTVPPWC